MRNAGSSRIPNQARHTIIGQASLFPANQIPKSACLPHSIEFPMYLSGSDPVGWDSPSFPQCSAGSRDRFTIQQIIAEHRPTDGSNRPIPIPALNALLPFFSFSIAYRLWRVRSHDHAAIYNQPLLPSEWGAASWDSLRYLAAGMHE
jgi:hypothetical protein